MITFPEILAIGFIAWVSMSRDCVLAGRNFYQGLHPRIRRNASSLFEDSIRQRRSNNFTNGRAMNNLVQNLSESPAVAPTYAVDPGEANISLSNEQDVVKTSERNSIDLPKTADLKPMDFSLPIERGAVENLMGDVSNDPGFATPKPEVSQEEEQEEEEELDDQILKDVDKTLSSEKNDYYIRPFYIDVRILDRFLVLHNNVRSRVSPMADQMLKMSWDYTLEGNAWKYTQKCHFDPSQKWERFFQGFPIVGENRWVGWGFAMDELNPEKVVATWLNEKNNFDASLRACIGDVCEDYVQLVFTISYKLGCAYSLCEKMSLYGFDISDAVFVACHYAPGRSEYPLIPYYHGQSCSFCNKADTCEYRLCANPDRDKTTGTYPYPDQPPTGAMTTTTLPLSEEIKIAIIVTGSLAGFTLLVTFVILFGVRAARTRAEGELASYFRIFPRRLSLWYENRRRNTAELNNNTFNEVGKSRTPVGSKASKASIEYHANLWNQENTSLT